MGNRKVKEMSLYQAEENWPVVTYFKEEMLRKLIKNNHKGGWEDDSMHALISRLKDELGELESALEAFENLPINLKEQESIKTVFKDAIRAEAADVGNFAMMIFDNTKNL
jgi:NTP pyrophosphatase (non-canonical NTP hydrolase)